MVWTNIFSKLMETMDYESVTSTLADGVHRNAAANDLIGLDLAEDFKNL